MKYILLFISFTLLLEHSIEVVDDFDKEQIGELPRSWNKRKKSNLREYVVKSDSSGKYLSARTENSDMMIVKKIEVDVVKYPYLNWRWRVQDLPIDGDESIKSVCDVPASISIVVGGARLIPKSIKYSWSSTLPIGTATKSPFAFWPARTDIVVLESGADKKGQWITEKVNILEDYKRLYGKDKVKSKVVRAIAIMSDSDNTESVSSADYDDIYFSQN